MLHRVAAVLLALTLCAPIAVHAQAQKAPVREITQIKDNVYRFRNNFHFSVFAVTPAGIIATDPINADAAKWLKAELAARFNVPVRFLVYSHDHADHISGGEVFADTATIIAHEKAKRAIIGEKRPTAVPQLTFSDRLRLDLGDLTLEMYYLGRGHSESDIAVLIPEEKVLLMGCFFLEQGPLPFFGAQPVLDPDRWLEVLGSLLDGGVEIDHVVLGQHTVWPRERLVAVRDYIALLWSEVRKLDSEGVDFETTMARLPIPAQLDFIREGGASEDDIARFHRFEVTAMWRQLKESAAAMVEQAIGEGGAAFALLGKSMPLIIVVMTATLLVGGAPSQEERRQIAESLRSQVPLWPWLVGHALMYLVALGITVFVFNAKRGLSHPWLWIAAWAGSAGAFDKNHL